MRIQEEKLIREVLEKLYDDYFPDTCPPEVLCKRLGGPREPPTLPGRVKAIGVYLKDKGLITEDRGAWRITGQGIDALHGRSLI